MGLFLFKLDTVNPKQMGVIMKVVYHRDYEKVYTMDPAAKEGRMERIRDALKGIYDFITPDPAKEEDILRVHTRNLLELVKRQGVYDIALLAAGGAIKAGEIAMDEPSFALIRPPGHHAGKNFNGGFCYFNNLAVAIEYLRAKKGLSRFLIVDIDLHYGNGTFDIFKNDPDVFFLNMEGMPSEKYLRTLKERLEKIKDEYHMLCVSAGFDCYELDWGGFLRTEDYKKIGEILRDFSIKKCLGRRFAVLEGGYYLPDPGKNAKSFLEGFSNKD